MTFNFANQELLAKFPSTIKIQLNKETKLYFDLTQISLFDANTKDRV
jgi:multiple sugar transport system ATP-binding protein